MKIRFQTNIGPANTWLDVSQLQIENVKGA